MAVWAKKPPPNDVHADPTSWCLETPDRSASEKWKTRFFSSGGTKGFLGTP